jgi:hypothetical protein
MRLPGWLTDNFRLKLFALLLTTLVYGIVMAGRTYERELSFSVAVDGLGEDKVLVGQPPEIRVRLAATPGGFSSLGDPSRRVIHLTLPASGKGRFGLSDADLALPRGVKALSISPASFDLRLENLVTKTLPVRAESKGTPATGHQVTSMRPIPDKIQVRGPQSVFASLSHVTAEAIDVEGRDRDFSARARFTTEVPFVVLPSDGVDVAIGIESTVGSRTLSKVAVQLLGPRAERASLDRKSLQVRLRGPRAVLDELDAAALFATVDLLALPSQFPGTYAVTPRLLNLPEEVEVQRLSPETLKLTLR